MKRILALAGLLATLAGPAPAGSGYPLDWETCDTLEEATALKVSIVKAEGQQLTFLDGASGRALVAKLIPSPNKLLWRGDRFLVTQQAGAAVGFVEVSDDACGGFGSQIAVDAGALRASLDQITKTKR